MNDVLLRQHILFIAALKKRITEVEKSRKSDDGVALAWVLIDPRKQDPTTTTTTDCPTLLAQTFP